MLSKQERGKLEKAFRSFHLTQDLSFRVEEDEIILNLNLPYTDLEGCDTFHFYGDDIESAESFTFALSRLAEGYDPIESLVGIFRMRASSRGEEKAKDCLRYDLTFVDTVDRTLGHLAGAAKSVLATL